MKKTKTATKITGIENIPQGPCVFISNHQGIFDGFLFFGFINKPIGFIAKKEIKKLPLISGWLEMLHTVFIDRENIRESVKAINAGVENVKRGYSMIIFPEGTRSLGGKMKEFKRGSMKLAFNAGVPVVPVTIEGTYKVLETGNHVTGNKLHMVIHKPIDVTKLSKEEKSNFAVTVHDIIETELNKILDENKNV
ncbi:1-acyl-sn-glycerol-3-phosphate acyltransferase [Clostridium sp. JN-9]|nr:1-acyl-sn-glycerol-3-phosphate acyltransferase [Clostridium sp. JN-9]